MPRFFLFENALFHKDAAHADKSECERIVEQELHRVNDVRVLKRLQHAVKTANDKTSSRTEHTAVNHKRQKACKCDRTAVGELEKSCIRKHECQSHCNCAVND